MIPTLNSFAVAGVVQLPGMMTGQILSGVAPRTAVEYQILIFFLLMSSTAVSSLLFLLVLLLLLRLLLLLHLRLRQCPQH